MIDFSAIKNLNLELKFGKSGQNGRGGDGGSILIFTKRILGSGKIRAEGGNGKIGEKGEISILLQEKTNLKEIFR